MTNEILHSQSGLLESHLNAEEQIHEPSHRTRISDQVAAVEQEQEPRKTSAAGPRKDMARTAVHLENQHMQWLLVAHGEHMVVAVDASGEALIESGLEQDRQAQVGVRVRVRPRTCAVVAGAHIGTSTEPGSDHDLSGLVRTEYAIQGGTLAGMGLVVRTAASPHIQVCNAVACASFVDTMVQYMTVHDCA